jgi:hypothetical protein
MQNTCKILFFLLLAPAYCLAQSNFNPGYVITLKGDTLRGLIDYREWDNNPADIRFKANASGKTETFSVNNASEFEISGLKNFNAIMYQLVQIGLPSAILFLR